MLKRKGQVSESVASGSAVPLTPGQLNASTAAFAAIALEFDEMRQIGQQKRKLSRSILEPAAGSSDAAISITVDGTDWQTQTQLLKLSKSEIYLCRHPKENEFAIIQRFPAKSAYARTNGQGEILLKSADPRQLVHDYAGWAQHTLRFMASNLVAKAQRVAFEQFPEHNPGQVVRAIAERCRRMIGESVTVVESARRTNRQGQGVRT